MNKTMWKDLFWRAWFQLPHCKYNQNQVHRSVRERLNRELIEDASIVATNCVGGEISNALGLRFNSPFINCSMSRKDFVNMCYRLREYMEADISASITADNSVLVVLGGCELPPIRIRYIDDDDVERVLRDFKRRRARINYQKLILIVDDQGLDVDDMIRFESISCLRKVCLTAQDYSARFPSCQLLEEYRGKDQTGTYQAKSFSGLHKFETIWDYVTFLNGKEK